MTEKKDEIKYETHIEGSSEEQEGIEHVHAKHKQEFRIRKTTALWILMIIIVLGILATSVFTCGFRGCDIGEKSKEITQSGEQLQAGLKEGTFTTTGDSMCLENGKPIVILYSTTSCPHCSWVKDTFDRTVKSYGDSIAAYHWELNTMDNTLTGAVENGVPVNMQEMYVRYNPQGYVPMFVFGCKYMRTGNGYERTGNLTAEEDEFRRMIDMLISG
jgi:thiol-disulfide isomerase/thioredoxin